MTTRLLITWNLVILPCYLVAVGGEEDPKLKRIAGAFQSVVEELSPKAEVTYSAASESVQISYRTRAFQIHARSLTGEISSRAQERVGPGFKGFMLTARLQKLGAANQAVVPQTLTEPYWQTFIDVTPLEGTKKQIFWSLAYGSRLDAEVLSGIQKILNSFKRTAALPLPPAGEESDSKQRSTLVSFDGSFFQTRELLSARYQSIPAETRKKIEAFLLMRLGLSSTGSIQLIGDYRHPEVNGEAAENLLHFQQLDLMGTRLFWSVLVDPEASNAYVLYHTSGLLATGKPVPITNRAFPLPVPSHR